MGARITAWAGMATATALLLAGCGSDSDGTADDTSSPTGSVSTTAASSAPSASTTPAPAGTPRCGAVWKDGAKLPRVYRGCADEGLLVAADRIGCSSGQALVRYGNRFWAVAGGPIARTSGALLKDDDYTAALTSCRG
ncbi:MAG TPA: hypothetical protein VNS46_12495 [Nocardioides sp.]|nr:hypothetical protein [Nocardioides sp.]